MFCKMNGLGNDYIFVDSDSVSSYDINYLKKSKETIKNISDRNFGIGGDGVVIIEQSDVADAKMLIYNADGSEAKMCGNALRCVGKVLYEKNRGRRDEFTVETLSGEKHLYIISADKHKALIRTDIGKPKVIKRLNDLEFIDVGNPHIVFYSSFLDDDIMSVAKELSIKFDANVEAVQIMNGKLKMRVWERGSGETLACGTGAAAVAFSAYNKGLFGYETNIELKGGSLIAKIQDGDISLIGEAALNYIGEIDVKYYG